MFSGEVARNEDQTSEEERLLSEQKYRDILSYLVSAGYFRARSNVSAFEKVVGGMCWCMTHANASLDVDFLFQKDRSTGQTVKLAEEIVNTMRKMGCPITLSAHQISGHDWKQVHPAVVWLIKTMFEARDDKAGALRLFSEQQFDQNYQKFIKEKKQVSKVAAPERRFKYAGRPASEEQQVFACLLEYGDQGFGKLKTAGRDAARPKSKADAFIEKAMKAAEKDEEAARGREEQMEQQLQADMTKAQENKVGGSQIGQMVRLGAGEISAAQQRYEQARQASSKKSDAEAALEQRAVKARATVKAAKDKVATLETTLKPLRETAGKLKKERDEARAFNQKVEAEIAKLEQLEKKCDPMKRKDLDELKKLVAANETYKRQEQSFKAECKKKLAALKEELANADKKPAQESEKKIAEIEAVHSKVVAKDARLRRQVAAASRTIASTARLIDDVPTRAELVQYERRFHELYAQVAAKLDETRKYYELYNSLDEICKIHAREVTILNSIIDTFTQAMKTKASKQTFLQQLDDINSGLKKNLQAKQDLFRKAQERASAESKKHHLLVEEHRRYHTAVKDFHDECQKNDLLLARIAQN